MTKKDQNALPEGHQHLSPEVGKQVMGVKRFNIMHNIGKAKHVVNYHDGIKTHNDGSDFFDIAIFNNKKELGKFAKGLVGQGYIESSFASPVMVHVVAWRFAGGGGFDWYVNAEHADKAFEGEKHNVKAYKGQDWTACRFDVYVPSLDEATDVIDSNLDELCAKAKFKNGPIVFPYSPSEAPSSAPVP